MKTLLKNIGLILIIFLKNNISNKDLTISSIKVNQENNNKSFKTIFKEYKDNVFKDFWSNLGINFILHIGYLFLSRYIAFLIYKLIKQHTFINIVKKNIITNSCLIWQIISIILTTSTNKDNNIINFKNFDQKKWSQYFFITIDINNNLTINPIIQSLPLTIILLTISVMIINLLKSLIFPKRYKKTSINPLFFNSFFTACLLSWLLFCLSLF